MGEDDLKVTYLLYNYLFLKQHLHNIVLDGVEISTEPGLASSSQRSGCLLSASIKGMQHHSQLRVILKVVKLKR